MFLASDLSDKCQVVNEFQKFRAGRKLERFCKLIMEFSVLGSLSRSHLLGKPQVELTRNLGWVNIMGIIGELGMPGFPYPGSPPIFKLPPHPPCNTAEKARFRHFGQSLLFLCQLGNRDQHQPREARHYSERQARDGGDKQVRGRKQKADPEENDCAGPEESQQREDEFHRRE